MILQTFSSVMCHLLAVESGAEPHLDAVKDALILAQATQLTPPNAETVSNDRTALPSKPSK